MLGANGSKIIDALIGGETDVEELIKYCHGKIKVSREDIKEALKGKITEHHRFMLGLIRESMAYIEGFMTRVEDRIEEKSAFCKRLIELPGVSTLTAQGQCH